MTTAPRHVAEGLAANVTKQAVLWSVLIHGPMSGVGWVQATLGESLSTSERFAVHRWSVLGLVFAVVAASRVGQPLVQSLRH